MTDEPPDEVPPGWDRDSYHLVRWIARRLAESRQQPGGETPPPEDRAD